MRRIAESEHLLAIAAFVFPGRSADQVRGLLRSITTTEEFQAGVMVHFNDQVICRSIRNFTCSGLERLDPKENCLFVSNHRDIVLDSSLLQQQLLRNSFRTTEITFGNNLMSSQLIVDIGRSNKMFKVTRDGNPRDLYNATMLLSEYIRHTITRKGESVWIAQRGGRTKDGNDATDTGIVKMLCMSGESDPVAALCPLGIVPVAVSYQWEPCELFKVRELLVSQSVNIYTKAPGEDQASVLAGIIEFKGDVHVSVCPPVTCDELRAISAPGISQGEFHKRVSRLIDSRIHAGYRLFDTNYAAHDLRAGSDRWGAAGYYSSECREALTERMEGIVSATGGGTRAREIVLGIYANPVDNSLKPR